MKKLFAAVVTILCSALFAAPAGEIPAPTDFRAIPVREITDNPVELFGDNWGLLTAGDAEAFNMMTISWGTLGNLWEMPVVTVFVRPSRHTYRFMEESDFFTVSFFDREYRDMLLEMGTSSGRDVDKLELSKLTPVAAGDAVAFAEARMVLVCRKVYAGDLSPDDFVDKEPLEKNYPDGGLHRFYIAEIAAVWVR